jgi:thiol-disulfide isomerase/thioredoxin
MADAPNTECPNCKRLLAIIEQLHADYGRRIAELEARIARLEKNSSNSHKPPSSDIVKPLPPPAPDGSKRKIGGQPGHERHDRAPYQPDEIDRAVEFTLDRCPVHGGPLKPSSAPPRVLQQVDLVDKPVVVTEYRAPAYWCPTCETIHYAPLPKDVVACGLAGPRLTALIAWLKGGAHASYSTIQNLFRDVLLLPLSTGQIAKLISKTRRALDPVYAELRAALPGEKRLNVDETGHKERRKGFWTWGFRGRKFTVFRIDASRGSEVLIDALGRKYAGVIGCDYFSAYRKYHGDTGAAMQFCWAHLIRDVKFLLALPSRTTRRYGQRLLAEIRAMFRVIHRRAEMTAAGYRRALGRMRRRVMAAALHPTWTAEVCAMAERFRKHAASYFRFIGTPGVDPTNNAAEQALRFVVIDRRITQGTRGPAGRAWCERIWSAAATCAQQGRSLHQLLVQAIQSLFSGLPAPSLLSIPS